MSPNSINLKPLGHFNGPDAAFTVTSQHLPHPWQYTCATPWYALRRTLPEWKFDAVLAELLVKVQEYKIDEVIAKVDVEEFSHGQISLDWLRGYQPKLFTLKAELENRGVAYSLNPWITLGHLDRGREAAAALQGIVTAVDYTGAVSRNCACALSGVWQQNTVAAWTIYAETRPKVMWVEDDIRTFNHGPVRWGCFCDLHLQRFSGLAGRTVGREELVNALLASGKPHPWRKLYLEMQGRIMVQIAAMLGQTVHAVSPETCLGLMSSGPAQHCAEGRRWHEFAEALADGKPLYSRPPLANYWEGHLKEFNYSAHSIKATRNVLPAGTVEQSEVENVPFTQYSKSAAATFLQMALSFAHGCSGVTMNLYDHMGSPMEMVPQYGRMLAAKKPFFTALRRELVIPGRFRGIRLLHHNQSAIDKVLSGGGAYEELIEDGLAGAHCLENLGVATDYNAASGTVMAFGQTLRSFTDAEIENLFSAGHGLFVDAVALKVLLERGFGHLLGIAAAGPVKSIYRHGPFSAEEFFNQNFGGHDQAFLTINYDYDENIPAVSELTVATGAQVVSAIVDADVKRHFPMFVAFENSAGSRVVVSAIDFSCIANRPGFLSPLRLKQIHAIIDYLSFGRVPLLVSPEGAFPMAIRYDSAEAVILTVFNLSLDSWHRLNLTLEYEGTPSVIERLEEDGAWRDVAAKAAVSGGLKIDYCGEVSFEFPLVLRLRN